jgi:hypothetical protein
MGTGPMCRAGLGTGLGLVGRALEPEPESLQIEMRLVTPPI